MRDFVNEAIEKAREAETPEERNSFVLLAVGEILADANKIGGFLERLGNFLDITAR